MEQAFQLIRMWLNDIFMTDPSKDDVNNVRNWLISRLRSENIPASDAKYYVDTFINTEM